MNKHYGIIIGAIGLSFLSGMALQYIIADTTVDMKSDEQKIKYWVAPMDSNYRRDKPGKSPMGMDLVPVYEGDEASAQDASIKISPTIEHNLGVRTAKVEGKDLSREINTVGLVAADENRVEHTHVYAEGWIRELLVKAEGETVKQGQLLFRMYSPKIVNAQEEYVLALRNKNKILEDAAEKKLGALGFSQKQLDRVRRTKEVSELTDVYAEQDGAISQLNIAEGMFVKPDNILIVLEDLSSIWMIAEVYERQSNWVQVGQKAEMTLPYLPGRMWSGKVNYIYPTLNEKSQTLSVRLMFENLTGDLKLNMFADVKIYADPKRNAVSIPKEAVIFTGKETRVVVKLDEGKYISRPIKIGIESNGDIEVLEGLKEGEMIVTSAQFLIDSESSLSASFNRMSPDTSGMASPGAHQH